MSMLRASAWVALRRIDETGDLAVLTLQQNNEERLAAREISRAHQALEAE